MRKNLLLSALLVTGISLTNAQELLKGGNMENASNWQYSSPNGSDVTDLVSATFNYTDDVPTNGSGGSLRLTGFGTTRSVTWQGVTLTPGKSYILTGLIKNISSEALTNTWVEVILSRNEPDPTKDYGAGTGDYMYTNNSWMSEPYGNFEGLDGTLFETTKFVWKSVLDDGSADSTLASTTITIPDTTMDNSWFVAIKAGCWNTAGVETPTFDFVFDNISLVATDATAVAQMSPEKIFNVYPNPSNGMITVKGLTDSYNVYNTAGMLIKSGQISNGFVNLNDLKEGVYMIKLSNATTSEIHKILIK